MFPIEPNNKNLKQKNNLLFNWKNIDILGIIAFILVSMLFGMGSMQIILRFFFRKGIMLSEEFMRLILATIVFFGAIVAYKDNRHINTGLASAIFPSRFASKYKLLSGIIITLFCIILLNTSISYMIKVASMRTVSLGVSVNIFYILIPLFCLSTIIITIKQIILIIKNWEGK